MPRPNNLIEQNLNMAAFGWGGPQLVRFTLEGGLSTMINNTTGAPIGRGALVKPDAGNDRGLAPTVGGDTQSMGVVAEDIPAGAYGFVAVAGVALVNVDNACNRGDWLGISAVTVASATASAVKPAAPVGVALTTGGPGQVLAMLRNN